MVIAKEARNLFKESVDRLEGVSKSLAGIDDFISADSKNL